MYEGQTAWTQYVLAIREPLRLFPDSMRTERLQVRNFVNGEFVEAVPLLVIPSEVEESLDISARSLL